MHVEVFAPDQYSGDLMGDLSARRGRIAGSEVRGHNVVIKAQVPFAEMLTYANDLISKTQGRATYTMDFSHYDYVPNELAEKVIATHKPHRRPPRRRRRLAGKSCGSELPHTCLSGCGL